MEHRLTQMEENGVSCAGFEKKKGGPGARKERQTLQRGRKCGVAIREKGKTHCSRDYESRPRVAKQKDFFRKRGEKKGLTPE